MAIYVRENKGINFIDVGFIIMAEKIKFGDMEQSGKKRYNKFITIIPDTSVTIRFVGHQEKIYSKWDPDKKSSTMHETKVEGSVMRVASLVIDRNDNNIKAYLCPVSVFNQLTGYGPEHDFKISRKGTHLSTKYHVESLGKTEVSIEKQAEVDTILTSCSLIKIFNSKKAWGEKVKVKEEIESRFDILDWGDNE